MQPDAQVRNSQQQCDNDCIHTMPAMLDVQFTYMAFGDDSFLKSFQQYFYFLIVCALIDEDGNQNF
jgi:hypothetical protein